MSSKLPFLVRPKSQVQKDQWLATARDAGKPLAIWARDVMDAAVTGAQAVPAMTMADVRAAVATLESLPRAEWAPPDPAVEATAELPRELSEPVVTCLYCPRPPHKGPCA